MAGRRIVIDLDNNSNAEALINYIKSLDYARIEEDHFEVPEWQKIEVRQRLKFHEENPEDYLDFDAMMADIENEL
jgi:hypothetical protein